MRYQKLIKIAACVGVALIVSACASPPPYVLNKGELNRESDVFLNGISDRESVIVCYAKDGATARDVVALAKTACAQHSKRAVFREQNYMNCPLVTPISAVYDCVEDAPNSRVSNLFN